MVDKKSLHSLLPNIFLHASIIIYLERAYIIMKTQNFYIAICLATYNGEFYIQQQLDSILTQTYQDWILFIRDDCSTDNTATLLQSYAKQHPKQIIIIPNSSEKSSGSKNNFVAILNWVKEHYRFSYYMFSDQDDIWLETKIEDSLKLLQKTEKQLSASMPILLHTDLQVVDQDLNPLGESFFQYRALNPDVTDLPHLLVQNNVTGCTMMWNQSLNQLLNFENDQIAMHDWWITLAAACFGTIVCLKKPTILYRQHRKNVIGATRVNTPKFLLQRITGNTQIKETLNLSITQAKTFLDVYQKELTSDQIRTLYAFVGITQQNKLLRIFTAFRYHFLKQDFVQIIGELLYL